MARTPTKVEVQPKPLKEITVFTDDEGRIFRTQEEYSRHLEDVRKQEEAKKKEDLIGQLVRCVYPSFRPHQTSQFMGSLDVSGASQLQAFLQWLSINELEMMLSMWSRVRIVQPRR